MILVPQTQIDGDCDSFKSSDFMRQADLDLLIQFILISIDVTFAYVGIDFEAHTRIEN
jgi:hypothetical protein